MSLFRPGNIEMTKDAIEKCKFKKNAKILDIGCGEGDTVEYLTKECGFVACGIDTSVKMITEGKNRNANLDIKLGDGEFLEDYTSFTFDGVLMECVLSMINLPDEALHESFCVMKKGAKLVISDLYIKNPDPNQIKAMKIEAERQKTIPRSSGECNDSCAEEHKDRFVDFRLDGRFVIEPLIEQLKEIGYVNVVWEDRSKELQTYVAETIMEKGNLDDCIARNKDVKGTGYFMMIAEKPL